MNTPVRCVRPALGNARRAAARNQWLLILLVTIEWLFALGYVLVEVWQSASLEAGAALRVWFDLDREGTVPALFSALQFLAIAGVWFPMQASAAHRLPRRFFLLVGTVYLFLAADEWFQMHEYVRRLLRALDAPSVTQSFLRIGPWIPLYLAAGVVLLWLRVPFGTDCCTRRGDPCIGCWRAQCCFYLAEWFLKSAVTDNFTCTRRT